MNTNNPFYVIPKLSVGTGGVVPWAFTHSTFRPDFVAEVPSQIDAAYCLDAPHYMPSGAHLHHTRTGNFIERTQT
jgi:hypothetical protein